MHDVDMLLEEMKVGAGSSVQHKLVASGRKNVGHVDGALIVNVPSRSLIVFNGVDD